MQPIDFLFDLTYNPQTQRTTMSIQHKKGAPMANGDGTMQPDVVVTLLNELASILGFRKACVTSTNFSFLNFGKFFKFYSDVKKFFEIL